MNSAGRAQWVAVVAVFGAVWGAVEITLGALLRTAGIPLRGTLLAAVGTVIVLTACRTLASSGNRIRGCPLAVAAVACTLLPMSASRGFVAAMTSLLAEALLIELVLALRPLDAFSSVLAGALAGLVPPVQRLVTLSIYCGPAALSTFSADWLSVAGEEAQTARTTVLVVVALAMLVSSGIGALAGGLAWSGSSRILVRLGRAL